MKFSSLKMHGPSVGEYHVIDHPVDVLTSRLVVFFNRQPHGMMKAADCCVIDCKKQPISDARILT